MIDHLVYAVPDLSISGQLGIELSAGGRHVGRGTRNLLANLGGGAYLEVIGPDPDQPEPAGPRPFGIDELAEPKLVAWAIRVENIDDVVDRAKAQGYDPGPVTAMSRERPDGVLLQWRLTPMVPGVLPFLIDWGTTPHPTEVLPPGVELVSFTGSHPAPAEVNPALAILGEDLVVQRGDAGFVAVLRTPHGEVVLK